MFAGLRRYQRIIMAIAAIAIIPPFVIYFSPTGQQSFGGGPEADWGRLDGRPISTDEFLSAQKEAFLRMRVYTGQWPSDNERLTEFTYQQLLIISQLKEHGIKAGESAVARQALAFGLNDMDVFMKNIPRNALQISKADVMRFIEHETGFRELSHLVSAGSQLVPPREVEERFNRQHEEFVVETVFFTGSSYTNSLVLNDETLARHYTNYQSSYRLPERLQVAYVEIPKSNFFAQADASLTALTNLEAIIEQAYQSGGGTNFNDPKNPGVILNEKDAKAKIREDIRGQQALRSAYNRASEVADKMMTQEQLTLPLFEQSMNEAKQEVRVTSPFQRGKLPPELDGVPVELSPRLFELTNASAAIFPMPIMGENAVYLLAAKNRLPSQTEPFLVVKSKVAEDYLRTEGGSLATQAGTAFHSALTNDLSAGKSFAESAASHRHRVETLPPFSLSTETLPELEGRMDIGQLKNALMNLTNGAVSRFIYTRGGGAVVKLRERRPPAVAIKGDRFANFVQDEKFRRINEALGGWFDRLAQARLQRPASQRDAEAAQPPAAN
ncbi:MAG: hypothetical protein FJ405_16770 [Verrucomicrobia bacterium]|nr:hypothetical protein [Verrucomicrobiota bacterium]